MCGISGIINQNNNEVPFEDIQSINNLISHRGPDDEGFYFHKNLAFGHRRLSILDLSKDGHQPMSYKDRYSIIFNGEIYNYIEIKNKLLSYGYNFESKTDTEVILASYDKWGKECVNMFNGMWSFALHDKEKEIIFCSRDRFGIKPFYYTHINQKFIFGSEIKQLLPFFDKIKVNKKILIDFIVTRFEDFSNETFFKSIQKLEQGHNLIYDLKSNSFTIEKYYDISFTNELENLSIEESINYFKTEFYRSIDYRLRSDVKVGTCLSGGLDSSAVASVASKKYVNNLNIKQKFTAIHAKSTEESTDESGYAKDVAADSNLDLIMIEPSLDDFKNNIDEVVYTQEEPFSSPSVFMQYFVMKKAKELNCTVMLDGQGGDEILLGYEKYYPAVYIDIYKKYGFIEMLEHVRKSNAKNGNLSYFAILKYVVGSLFPSLRKKYLESKCFFLKKYENNFEFLDDLSNSYFKVKDLQNIEIKKTNLPLLLRYEDKNSMKHSVEARLPFLDYKTLEAALNINTEYKINNGWSKFIIRDILSKNLSHNTVWRKAKLGFNAPESTWVGKHGIEMNEKILDSTILQELSNVGKLKSALKTMDVRLKWRLYNVAVWERVYNVQI